MPLNTAAADYMLDQWGTNKALFMSLHSAYSASGANELTGGSYARVAITWSAAAANVKNLSGTPYNLNAPASSTVAYIGFWDASSGGNFWGMSPNAAGSAAFAFSAPSATSTLLAPGSSYAATTTVVAFPTGGSALPSGLTAGTVYFVKNPSGDSLQLSTTSGGTAISLSSDGSGYVQGIFVENFGSAGTFTLSSGSMSLV